MAASLQTPGSLETEVVNDRDEVDALRKRYIASNPHFPVDWSQPGDNYAPPGVVTTWVLDPTHNADPGDPKQVTFEQRPSCTGMYSFDSVTGAPLNPLGRTGVAGRGDLEKWGPNYAADPVVFAQGNDQKLYVLLVLRKDTGQWALPGGMVEDAESADTAALRELAEETGLAGKLAIDRRSAQRTIVGDSRNTDNAWIESAAFHVRVLSDPSLQLDKNGLPLVRGGDDAIHAQWFACDTLGELAQGVADERRTSHPGISDQDQKLGLYASHATIIASLLKP